ncbi:MAG: carboxypeptidase regulatory-like domain-containing protein, partial [Chloracidobacterium sp.]|nr:carboxypeptidase regulatory-like domain-containing protein [Chloracidobacterium sp.]
GDTKTGTATVSGRVTLKGEPARAVMVVLQTQNQNASNAPRARTDESGRFNFTGVHAGTYSVSAAAPGYVSPDDTNFGMRGKTLNLADGEKVENIDLEIKRGGVIAGKITDSQGRPVIEERINLSKFDANNQPRSYFNYAANYDNFQTDDRGLYRIYGLPEGRYLVSAGYAARPGSVAITSRREFYPRVYYPDATSESEAKVIKVSEGSVAEDIDITVPDPKSTYDVYGRVVDADSGQPVAGVEVALGGVTTDGRYAGGYAGGGVRSAPNGEFRIFGALPGKYALIVPPEEGSGFVSDPVIFDISEGDATGLELKVRKGASISGVAVIEGTNDQKVLSKLSQVNLLAYIRPVSPDIPATPVGRRPFKINADGSFRIEGLQAGKATIMVMPTQEMRGLRLGRTEYNGAPAPEGVEVDPGEQVTGVRLILVYGSLKLRGEVKIVGGAVPAGQRLYAQARTIDHATQNGQSAEVDARGQFVIENLTPGEYEVRVMPSYYPDDQRLSQEIMRRMSLFKEKVVLSGADQQPITLVIDLSQKERER